MHHIIAEYIWVDASKGMRGKTKVIYDFEGDRLKPSNFPSWNFDGSSTGQASGDDSEVIIEPVAVYNDPFRKNEHVIVLCACFTPQGEPVISNTRTLSEKMFDAAPEEEPWFGIEQEYTLFTDGAPLGWPSSSARSFGGPTVQIGFPGPQGPYYCAAGADVAFGRDVVEEHLQACIYAGINISGINAEVLPGQWEFQVGPCLGIASGDQLWVSRYILNRVCENHNIVVSYDPKPIPGDWNGSGCHTNFSTKAMRNPGGLDNAIIPALLKMAEKHSEHIAVYGEGNDARLTGEHETASMEEFKWGVADRGASVRIGNQTKHDGCGYFEDRRPASNMDPYIVTSKIFQTCCL